MNQTTLKEMLLTALIHHEQLEPSFAELKARNLLPILLQKYSHSDEVSEDEMIAFIECWRET